MEKPLSEKTKKIIPPEVNQVFKKFTSRGFEIYLVGAGVRNLILGKKPIDCDFTTNARPEEIQKMFKDTFYDNIFGTVGIPFQTKQGQEIYEITTYRTEGRYTDHRRPNKVKWGQKLSEDLKRRDFTWNAMVIGPQKKSLVSIDLFGGQKDLQNRIVRAVGNPEKRFQEDALRMMRAIRFASQLGFSIEKKTFAAIKKKANLIKKISQERIRDEFLKILASNFPADGYLLLRNTGLAKIILPEAEKMFGVEQKSPGRHHLYDVGTHSLNALKQCRATDPIVRLAAFLHDVGKPVVVKKQKNGTITFYNHEVIGASMVRNLGRRLRLSRKDIDRLTTLVRWHQFSVDERQTDKAIRRFIKNVGQENLTSILQIRVADRLGGGARETSWRLENFKKKLAAVQKQPFTITDLKINGHDVMKSLKIPPGPLVGKILAKLFEEVAIDKNKNKKSYLLRRLKTIAKKSI